MDQAPLTGGQIAAARAMTGLTQAELAQRANLSVPTLKRMEASGKKAAGGIPNNLAAIRAALESAGIVFLADGETTSGGPGVRLRTPAA